MNRITLALENDFEGKVIASFDLEEYAEQIRAEVIAEVSREMRLLYGNEYESKIRADAIDEVIEVTKGVDSYVADLVEEIFRLKEQK